MKQKATEPIVCHTLPDHRALRLGDTMCTVTVRFFPALAEEDKTELAAALLVHQPSDATWVRFLDLPADRDIPPTTRFTTVVAAGGQDTTSSLNVVLDHVQVVVASAQAARGNWQGQRWPVPTNFLEMMSVRRALGPTVPAVTD